MSVNSDRKRRAGDGVKPQMTVESMTATSLMTLARKLEKCEPVGEFDKIVTQCRDCIRIRSVGETCTIYRNPMRVWDRSDCRNYIRGARRPFARTECKHYGPKERVKQ